MKYASTQETTDLNRQAQNFATTDQRLPFSLQIRPKKEPKQTQVQVAIHPNSIEYNENFDLFLQKFDLF